MANKILVKRSAVASKVPTTSDLDLGEIGINTYDGKLYIKKDNGTASVVEIGGGGVSDGDKGDITVSSSGATWTVDNNAITDAKLRQSSGLSVVGRSASTTGNVGDVTGTADQVLRVAASGASLGFGAIDLTKSAAVSGILPSTNGGTANGFTKFSGPATSEKTFTLPNASASILTDNAAVTVAQGGTGRASATAYAVVCGGTTSTGAHQSVASVGTSGQVLTSNGAGSLPTFQAVSASVASGTMYENAQTVSSNYTITSNKNAFSVGPITLSSGVSVTIPSGSRWAVI